MTEEIDISKIKKKLKKNLDKKRYKHTKNVAEVARCLAMRYRVDLDKAYLAGYLHDCAKCFSDKEKFALCDFFAIDLTSEELENPALIHAKLGPYIAARDYGVLDKDIYDAICYHTTGRENMSMLEKIIYISDYIEPDRPELPRIELIREAAFLDIDTAMAMITEDTLNYLSKRGGIIDQNTRKAYDYYNSITKDKESNL